MKSLIITGTFDETDGKSSFFGQQIINEFNNHFDNTAINGGNLSTLNIDFTGYDVLVWMPNISNDVDKIIPAIKQANPTLLLVSSKRVIEKEYTESDVVGRLLKSKSNLGFQQNLNFQDKPRHL